MATVQYANKQFNHAYLSCDNCLKLNPDNEEAVLLMEKLKRGMGIIEKETETSIMSEKIKQMLNVSTKIKLEMMRKALKLQENIFSEKIFEWAEQFNFTIDGDYLIVNKDTIEDFMNALDAQFVSWRKKEEGSDGKI